MDFKTILKPFNSLEKLSHHLQVQKQLICEELNGKILLQFSLFKLIILYQVMLYAYLATFSTSQLERILLHDVWRALASEQRVNLFACIITATFGYFMNHVYRNEEFLRNFSSFLCEIFFKQKISKFFIYQKYCGILVGDVLKQEYRRMAGVHQWFIVLICKYYTVDPEKSCDLPVINQLEK